MKMNRRKFLKTSASASASLALTLGGLFTPPIKVESVPKPSVSTKGVDYGCIAEDVGPVEWKPKTPKEMIADLAQVVKEINDQQYETFTNPELRYKVV